MTRTQDIGLFLAQLVLVLALSDPPLGPFPTMEHAMDEARTLRIENTTTGRHCFDVELPEAGLWWAVLQTPQPSSAPSLMALGDRGPDPRTVARVDAVLLRVHRPDTVLVCTTSEAPLGNARIVLARAGDELEIEIDPDPVQDPEPDPTEPGDEAGDELEIEIDPDP